MPASFEFDAFGRRLTKTLGAETTEFLYDGIDSVQELSGGSPTANVLLGPGFDEVLQRTDSAGVRTVVADGLGSALALIDPTGAIQTQYTYGPFGATELTGEGTDNPNQHTGRERDGTEMYYQRARYYDTTVGRFVSEDPIEFAGDGVNLYPYVAGNPVNFTDRRGYGRVGVAIRIVKRLGKWLRESRTVCMLEAQNARRRGARCPGQGKQKIGTTD